MSDLFRRRLGLYFFPSVQKVAVLGKLLKRPKIVPWLLGYDDALAPGVAGKHATAKLAHDLVPVAAAYLSVSHPVQSVTALTDVHLPQLVRPETLA